MRIGNLDGRLVLLHDDDGGGAIDLATASGGRFGPDPQSVFERWDEFLGWVAEADLPAPGPFDPARLGNPVPAPRQTLAVGLNYRAHALEGGVEPPTDLPPVFAKFASSLAGPDAVVVLPDGHVDWEVELAVVIGRGCRNVPEAAAWDRVAGLTVAQDLSERVLQLSGPAPQFGLAKSHPGFTPLGPVVVTPDELADPDDVGLRASVNGEVVQEASTGLMIVGVAALIAALSAIIELYPGDVVLTGTPSGVGMARTPPRYLAPGDVLVSEIDGIGRITQRFRAR